MDSSSLDLGKNAEIVPGNFRLQNSRIHLTYPDHFDPQILFNFLTSISKSDISNYSIVNETGSTGHKHTHCLLKFSKLLQTKNPRFFDFQSSHPNIKIVSSDLHWNNCILYHKKQNSPFTNISLSSSFSSPSHQEHIQAVWNSKNVSDAVLNVCQSVKSVGGVIAAFNCKPIDYGPEPSRDWRPWQNDLYLELSSKPDDRSILWYWDPIGSAGKTFFAKHMGMYKGAFITTTGNVYHVATQLQDVMQNGDSILSVIFNFSRQSEAHKVYQAIEQLKDGVISSQKYHGKTLFFNSPHVVIFANYFPDVSQISLDRWKIRIIDYSGYNVAFNFSGFYVKNSIDQIASLNSLSFEKASDYFTSLVIQELNKSPPSRVAVVPSPKRIY